MAKNSITKTSTAGRAKQAHPAESPLDFLPFDQFEVGGLIAEALMARGTPGMGLILHQAMQGSSQVGLGFITACDSRMVRR